MLLNRRNLSAILLPALMTAGLLPLVAHAATQDAKAQLVVLDDAGKRFNFAIYSNIDLSRPNTSIRRVIIFQHGIKRDADKYYGVAMKLLEVAKQSPAENAVLAPDFATASDDVAADNMPFWRGDGWLQGQASIGGVTGVGAFSVLDDIAQYVASSSRFPALKEIIFIGHSAGGQLMQRYAALNNTAEALQQSGISVRYVISSPSSYMYFDASRPDGSGFTAADNGACPGYDNYRYGVGNMIPFGQGLNGEQLFARYAARDITYLVGARDNNPNHRYLDKSCGARLEGANRVERHRNFVKYEQFLAAKWHVTLRPRGDAEVPGAAHEAPGVFESAIAAEKIFAH